MAPSRQFADDPLDSEASVDRATPSGDPEIPEGDLVQAEAATKAEAHSPEQTRTCIHRGTARGRVVMGDRFVHGLDAAAHEPLMEREQR